MSALQSVLEWDFSDTRMNSRLATRRWILWYLGMQRERERERDTVYIQSQNHGPVHQEQRISHTGSRLNQTIWDHVSPTVASMVWFSWWLWSSRPDGEHWPVLVPWRGVCGAFRNSATSWHLVTAANPQDVSVTLHEQKAPWVSSYMSYHQDTVMRGLTSRQYWSNGQTGGTRRGYFLLVCVLCVHSDILHTNTHIRPS